MEASAVRAFRDGDKVTIIISHPTQKQLDQISRICQGGIDEVVGFKHKTTTTPGTTPAPAQHAKSAVAEQSTDQKQPSAAENRTVPEQPAQKPQRILSLEQAVALSRSESQLINAGPKVVRDSLVRYLSKDRQSMVNEAWKEIRKTKDKDDPKAIGSIANFVLKLFWEQYGKK